MTKSVLNTLFNEGTDDTVFFRFLIGVCQVFGCFRLDVTENDNRERNYLPVDIRYSVFFIS